LLLAGNPGQAPLEQFFDKDSGLLVRQLRFGNSPLGLNPTCIDYDDYKEFDGVKVPTHLTIARPRTQLDIQIDKVQQNVAVDDTQFEPPASATMVKQAGINTNFNLEKPLLMRLSEKHKILFVEQFRCILFALGD
jgi:hypothetical protein